MHFPQISILLDRKLAACYNEATSQAAKEDRREKGGAPYEGRSAGPRPPYVHHGRGGPGVHVGRMDQQVYCHRVFPPFPSASGPRKPARKVASL